MTSQQQEPILRRLLKSLALSTVLGAALAAPPAAFAQSNAPQAPESSPRVIQLLLQTGAYDLALQRIDGIQGEAAGFDEWLQWENLRYELYRKREEWDRLADRLVNLPAEVPEIRRHELMTRAAELLLGAGRGTQSREILRALIWRGGGDSRQLNYWRRLVVRSYLVDDLTRDAGIAMHLYEKEYLPADADWDYLFAQVLLRQGDAAGAAERLGTAQNPPAKVLRLLSRLRAGVDDPQQVLERNAALREELPAGSQLMAASWAVSAEAAAQAADAEARVDALEQLFNGPGLPPEFGLFVLQPADLWDAYEDLGTRIGNEENLLFGDPQPWMALAKSLTGEGSALRARAINAAVALRARSDEEHEALHRALYERLEAAELKELAVHLYQAEAVFPAMEAVPNSVRHRIVSDAIAKRDMGRAARFAAHLAAPAEEQTQVQWDLTRARLALYAGDLTQSESIMRSLVLSQKEFDPETADRVMQPIFDLQSVGRGAAAFELLQYMRDRLTTDKQKREILLWMGDAKKSLGEYEAATEYYLRSAYAGPDVTDLWGQSARYHAAEALTEAALFEDARRIYEQLIREVGEGKRQAALQRRLQELWVKQQENGPSR